MDTTIQPSIVTPTTNFFLEALKRFDTEVVKRPKNYPLILVVGPSGTGKSRSIKNLPSESTAIVNIENKPLSFTGGEKFKYQFSDFKLPSDVDILIKNCFNEPAIKYIVIDSITKYLEMLHKHASDTKKGYDIWSYYNASIGAFLDGIKSCGPKLVILTGIDELVGIMQPSGLETKTRRLAVSGRQWEGKIEKEFTLVLFTDVKKVGEKIEYKFITNNDGTNSAKTPEDMFKENRVDNDLLAICNRVKEFYKLA